MLCLRCRLFQEVAARMSKQLCVLIFLSMITLPLAAADIEELQVTKNDGVYTIEMVVVVDVPVEYVHRVLTDYVHIYRLNPSITESEILPGPDNGAIRVRTRIVGCFFIFCMEINRVEDIKELSSDNLHAEIVPEFSNFKSGSTDWHMQGMGERSRVIYLAQMEPEFYIPPIIGSLIFKAKLRKDIVVGLMKLECLAKIQEELDWNPDFQVADINVDTVCAETRDSHTGQWQP